MNLDNNKLNQENKKSDNVESSTIETAAALRYEPGTDNAPVVVAVGKGETAKNIKKLAKELHIPIVKDPVLAQTLHDLGTNVEIPAFMYEAVARVLAYVYEIDQANKK